MNDDYLKVDVAANFAGAVVKPSNLNNAATRTERLDYSTAWPSKVPHRRDSRCSRSSATVHPANRFGMPSRTSEATTASQSPSRTWEIKLTDFPPTCLRFDTIRSNVEHGHPI